MRSVMLVFASPDTASKVKSVLVGAGLPVAEICQSGAVALQQAMLRPSGGVVIVPPRLKDMSVPELLNLLPDTYDLLVLQSNGQRADYDALPGMTLLTMPLSESALVETVASLLATRTPGKDSKVMGKSPDAPAASRRSLEEQQLLLRAKEKLIARRRFTEDQAHRYLQRQSMVTGTRIVEIARQVLEQEL